MVQNNQSLAQPGSLDDILRNSPNIGSSQVMTSLPIIEDLLYQSQLMVIKAKTGGTWIGAACATGIAAGGTIASRFKCPNPTGVFYLQGGMPHKDMVQRIQTLHKTTEDIPIVVASPEMFNAISKPNLADPVSRRLFLNRLEQDKNYKVIILDSISPYLTSKTKPDDLIPLFIELRRLNFTTIWVISDEKSVAPVPWDLVDIGLEMNPVEGFDPLVLKVDFSRARSLAKEHQKGFVVELVDRENGKKALASRT